MPPIEFPVATTLVTFSPPAPFSPITPTPKSRTMPFLMLTLS